MAQREWLIPQADKSAVAALRSAGFSRVTATLLALRGFNDPASAKSFISCDACVNDPMQLKDMPAAAQRIAKALSDGEKITVYGDYDADGVTATALLYAYLKNRGADAAYYIPDRESEGYGLNPASAQKIAQDGTKLVITVDTGISAFDEAELFKTLGVCLIVTDHHDPREALPAAFAIVNPKQPGCEYPFKELAGVGVAFKLICAIEQLKPDGLGVHALFQKYGELVCLGTVADVVPLKGENRYIVSRGIKLISENPGVGMSALLIASGVHGKRLTSSLLSFTAAPRINACGRISTANDALELLLADNVQKAEELAKKLDANNRERRDIEAQILKESIEKIDNNEALRNNPLLIVSGEGWHNGVVGIVAARLVELYGKPAVVVSFDGDIGRASCRSIAGFNIHEALMSCSQYLERFGGHEFAAGFTVSRENYDALYAALNRIANSLPELPTLKVCPDMRLRGNDISLSTAREVKRLEPFGSGNPAPLFYIPAAQIISLSPVGDGHTRMLLNFEGFEFNAVMFGTAKNGFDFKVPDIVDLAVSIDVNLYKNKEMLSIVVRNIRKSACFEYYSGLYKTFLAGKAIEPEALRQKLTPNRAEFAAVYRLLCAGSGSISLEASCKALCRRDAHFNYFKTLLINDVFTETGLVTFTNESGSDKVTYQINRDKKINLSASALLKRLG